MEEANFLFNPRAYRVSFELMLWTIIRYRVTHFLLNLGITGLGLTK